MRPTVDLTRSVSRIRNLRLRFSSDCGQFMTVFWMMNNDRLNESEKPKILLAIVTTGGEIQVEKHPDSPEVGKGVNYVK
jgi:hypothetical protein